MQRKKSCNVPIVLCGVRNKCIRSDIVCIGELKALEIASKAWALSCHTNTHTWPPSEPLQMVCHKSAFYEVDLDASYGIPRNVRFDLYSSLIWFENDHLANLSLHNQRTTNLFPSLLCRLRCCCRLFFCGPIMIRVPFRINAIESTKRSRLHAASPPPMHTAHHSK